MLQRKINNILKGEIKIGLGKGDGCLIAYVFAHFESKVLVLVHLSGN